jgi:hypothetical protein
MDVLRANKGEHKVTTKGNTINTEEDLLLLDITLTSHKSQGHNAIELNLF